MTLRSKPNVVNGCGKENVSPTVAVSIAGFDPSSGAGVTADLKVFAAHGVYGVAAITALTVQSTQGARRVEPISGQLVRETLECLAEDLPLSGVKIGMLGTAEVVRAVAGWLRQAGIPRERIVLDPVLRSSSGKDLLEPGGVEAMRSELLPAAGWVTPNVDELGALVGEHVTAQEDVPLAAKKLAALAPGLNVIVTGGHLEPPDEFLLTASGEEHWLAGRRVETTSTHGTGCAFSSALLCRVMAGGGASEAVWAAKEFVTHALETAVKVGQGNGPVFTGDLQGMR